MKQSFATSPLLKLSLQIELRSFQLLSDVQIVNLSGHNRTPFFKKKYFNDYFMLLLSPFYTKDSLSLGPHPFHFYRSISNFYFIIRQSLIQILIEPYLEFKKVDNNYLSIFFLVEISSNRFQHKLSSFKKEIFSLKNLFLVVFCCTNFVLENILTVLNFVYLSYSWNYQTNFQSIPIHKHQFLVSLKV